MNDFLLKNNYLKITKNEKFSKCYMVLTDEKNRNENYKILLDNIKSNNTIVKKIDIFNFNFNPSYFYTHKNMIFINNKKAENLINKQKENIDEEIIPKINDDMCSIYKCYIEKKIDKDKISNIMKRIKLFLVGNKNICIYNSNVGQFEKIINEYNSEKVKIESQKVEMRLYQLTEEAKSTQKNNINKKKDCCIF